MRKPISADLTKEIYDYWLGTGKSQKEIGIKFGLNGYNISVLLSRELKQRRMATREKVDLELEKIAKPNCQIGKDSTQEEKWKIKEKITKHMNIIRQLDIDFYNTINPA